MHIIPLIKQTIQVCISAGALSNLQNTLYTGIAQGYSLLTFAMFYFLCKVSGPFTLACMEDSLKLFDSLISIKLKYVLITLAASTLVWGVAEELIQPAKVRFLWMLVGFFLITIYMTFVLLNFWGYNMISIPFLILHGVACVPIFYTFIEILNPNLKIIENSINERMKQKSTKFVLPINTTLSNPKASKSNSKND